MKRCPECRRDYHDHSLLYCLDDGSALLEGPATASTSDEPATVILHETAPPAEAATRAQIHTTEQTDVLPSGRAGDPKKMGLDRKLVVAPIALAVIVLGGYLGYRYISMANSKQIESIAVMPFANETEDSGIEYLADGMTETLIRNLSQLPNLSVKARSSVFRYKDKEPDAKTLGKDLDVQAVLTGRFVPRGGEVLHLSLELIDTRTENVIWTNDYDRKPSELILLQNAIARDVSAKLRPARTGSDQPKATKNYTENAEAYRLYLQGRYFWNKRSVPGFKDAIKCFEQSLALDPNYALAYSGLADSYTLLAVYRGAAAKDSMPQAKDAAIRALALDPDLAEAHASLGQVLQTYDYDFSGAEREYRRALELNANYASAHQWYAELLTQVGRFDEAFASIGRALALDPFNLVINRENGGLRFYAREYDKCIDILQKAVVLEPNFSGFHYDLSSAYQMKGNYPESVKEFARWRELEGDAEGAALSRTSFAKGGWREFARSIIAKGPSLGLKPYNLAVFHIALGENDAAISEFNKAYDQRINDVYWMKEDPRLDPVRSDPRFQELLKKVNFPE